MLWAVGLSVTQPYLHLFSVKREALLRCHPKPIVYNYNNLQRFESMRFVPWCKWIDQLMDSAAPGKQKKRVGSAVFPWCWCLQETLRRWCLVRGYGGTPFTLDTLYWLSVWLQLQLWVANKDCFVFHLTASRCCTGCTKWPVIKPVDNFQCN